MTSSDFGEFLRACRASIDPIDVGLPRLGIRRVTGLRREEVAALAGISSHYYTRLEQGRKTKPTAQVVDSLARAMKLNDDGREHSFRLAGVIPIAPLSPVDQVDPVLGQLIKSMPLVAAFVTNRALDILAVSELATALLSPYEQLGNVAKMVFCDPVARSSIADWTLAAESAVSALRSSAEFDSANGRLKALRDELSQSCSEFRKMWAGTNSLRRDQDRIANTVIHPDVGRIEIECLVFSLRGTSEQRLIVLAAKPGSPSADSLALLGSLHSTRRIG